MRSPLKKTKKNGGIDFLNCSPIYSYTAHAPKTIGNSLLPSLPFPSLPTTRSPRTSLRRSHCATHLYLTNRCLITRTAISPSCVIFRYSYGYSHAVPASGCVSTIYGSEAIQKHQILPVFSDIIISHFMTIGSRHGGPFTTAKLVLSLRVGKRPPV
jgi:hypothetical protein